MISIDVRTTRDVGTLIALLGDAIQPTLNKAVMKGAALAGGKIAEVGMATFKNTTGALPRSFLPPRPILTSGPEISAGALSGLAHADIQNRGGTIVPRTAKRLAIPLTPKARKRWPRDWPSGALTLIVSRKGNTLLAEIGKKGKIVPQYVLEDSVRLTGQGYIDAAAEQSAQGIDRIMVNELDAAFSSALERR